MAAQRTMKRAQRCCFTHRGQARFFPTHTLCSQVVCQVKRRLLSHLMHELFIKLIWCLR